METKLFEVRDRMTFLPVIAVKLEPGNPADRYLLAMAGFGLRAEKQAKYILLGNLRMGKLECSPSDHAGHPQVRTLPRAHRYIQDHWDELESGQVVDVEFIAGETTVAKLSQRLEGC